ncbi:MAG: cysteine dioxygenase family protein [Pirellulales bacterium]|nr:cysteine dioxygenase family protein [Pirellulales bacterium]
MSVYSANVFSELDRHQDAIPLDEIMAWLNCHEFQIKDLGPWLRYDPERYQRNLLHAGPAYQALLLCWRNGQRSPIHDHLGSACGVKVLSGCAIETTFDLAPNGMVYPVHSRTLDEGSVCGSFDADKHQISNLQTDQADLVTMHIYSPPLLRMNMYSLTDGAIEEFSDPVNAEYEYGGGI